MISLRLGIRARALLLAIAPLLLVSAAIGYYLIDTRVEDARASRAQHGAAVARDLAKSSGFGLYVGDEKLLLTLISGALASPGIATVTILDDEGKVIASKARHDVVTGAPGDETAQEFVEPIYPPPAREDGGSEFAETPGRLAAGPTPLGRVIVRITHRDLVARETEIFWRSLWYVAAGIALSVLLGALLGSSVLAPLQQIFDVVARLRRGDLSARAALTSRDEFGLLESGINEMAETIERAQRALQQRVEAATEQLQATVESLRQSNRELERARAEAVHSGNAKAEFLAQMSHELRTPLNAIIGFGQLLETTTDAQDRREYAAIVANSGRQLLTVINDVLSFAHLGAGTVELSDEVFDAAEVIENAVALFAHEAHAKDLELVLQYRHDAPRRVRGDPVRFGQVLGNLLNNAIKFTGDGSVVVLVSRLADGEDKVQLRVTVTDTGIGIDEASRARLFEPFVQGDASITRRFGGTGLGLAISKSLITRMGGSIGVAEHEGPGASFYITLPATLDAEATEAQPTHHLGGDALVIDSHPVSRRVLRNQLLRLGSRVTQAASLRAVLPSQGGAVPAAGYDIVIVGINRREAGLREIPAALLELRAVGRHILVLVGDEVRSRELAAALPSRGYAVATKPIRHAALIERLVQLLGFDPHTTTRPASLPTSAAVPQWRFLIGEDNAHGRRLLRTLLERFDATVAEAPDGEEALRMAQANPYDAIFLDVHMPLLDGGTVCRRLRAESGPNHRTPVFAVTADITFNSPERISAWGFTGAILKPVVPRELAAALNTVLQRPVAPPADESSPPSLRRETVAEVRRLVGALRRALDQQDRADIQRLAHQIAGLAGFFEIAALRETAQAIEAGALTEAFDSLRDHTEALEQMSTEQLAARVA